MGLFGKKKKKEEKEKPKIPLRPYRRVLLPPGVREPTITTREYRLFRKTEKGKLNWYERLTGIALHFMKIDPDKRTKADLENAIEFTGLRIKPEGVMSLFVTTIIFFVIISIVLAVIGIIPMIGTLLIIAFSVLLGYYFLKYPTNVLKSMRVEASSQIVLAILYMVVSMRISPNLERALKFAAANVSGVLAWDMRRLLWDIEMRKYYSVNDAMDAYMVKWKPENEEFAESLRLIRDSQKQVPERARTELDEALNVILNGTKTRMKHYAQDLRLPVMVIHMMGIVLPILGTIMAPLAAVFMSNLVNPIHFILGYNIVLPIIIVWFIKNTLSKRPITFSKIDVEKHPDLPPRGRFLLKKRSVPVLPFAVIILLVFLIPPILYFTQNPTLLVPPMVDGEYVAVNDPNPFFTITMSALITLGVGFAMAIYFILSNFQAIRIQNDIQKIEGEFELALFQLGNKISGGTPTEVAIERSIDDMKDLKISELFRMSLRNIRNLGMTFEQSLFDKNYGALRYYTSRLIKNIMYTIVDTAKKGVRYASESMLRIARYLKNIRETQEYIRDMLSETVSSMKFQAYFLTPLITGLIVSMADIIVQVLSGLGRYLEGMNLSSTMGLDFSLLTMGVPSTTPPMFQLIIGVYLIEVIVLLAMFITKIDQGENPTAQWYNTGKMLIIAVVIYFLISLASTSMFGELISSALAGLGIIT
ncbi:MAG: hypothetical protein JSW41_01430 [Candidatus Aenigmatarchaeota archaeon]|nr:MAG: hypothetical protein JSW41_01430 [Candidatus Aenigmarchaeota archaeon]